MSGAILGSGHSAAKKEKISKNPHLYGDDIVVREKKEPQGLKLYQTQH